MIIIWGNREKSKFPLLLPPTLSIITAIAWPEKEASIRYTPKLSFLNEYVKYTTDWGKLKVIKGEMSTTRTTKNWLDGKFLFINNLVLSNTCFRAVVPIVGHFLRVQF